MNDEMIDAFATLCAQQQAVFSMVGALVQGESDPAVKLLLLEVSEGAARCAVEAHGVLVEALGSAEDADAVVARAGSEVELVDLRSSATTDELLGALVDELLPATMAAVERARDGSSLALGPMVTVLEGAAATAIALRDRS